MAVVQGVWRPSHTRQKPKKHLPFCALAGVKVIISYYWLIAIYTVSAVDIDALLLEKESFSVRVFFAVRLTLSMIPM